MHWFKTLLHTDTQNHIYETGNHEFILQQLVWNWKKKKRNVNGNEYILGKVINPILDLNLLFIYQIIMKQPHASKI